MPKIYFDIGANDGSSMSRFADEPDSHVFAFEPTPRMVNILRDRYSHLPNYHIIQKAVSDIPGTQKFFVAGNEDWGCSSLCNFQESCVLEQTWPGRKDFKVTEEIEVEVIRLDSFIENLSDPISEIEYFHCDVQGKDLEVLKSMGSYLGMIKEGVIEMPTSHNAKLYTDQKWLAEDAIKFLEENGFEIIQIISNDAQTNEVNIYFKRRRGPDH
jgi:FkbM family methyltransferase